MKTRNFLLMSLINIFFLLSCNTEKNITTPTTILVDNRTNYNTEEILKKISFEYFKKMDSLGIQENNSKFLLEMFFKSENKDNITKCYPKFFPDLQKQLTQYQKFYKTNTVESENYIILIVLNKLLLEHMGYTIKSSNTSLNLSEPETAMMFRKTTFKKIETEYVKEAIIFIENLYDKKIDIIIDSTFYLIETDIEYVLGQTAFGGIELNYTNIQSEEELYSMKFQTKDHYLLQCSLFESTKEQELFHIIFTLFLIKNNLNFETLEFKRLNEAAAEGFCLEKNYMYFSWHLKHIYDLMSVNANLETGKYKIYKMYFNISSKTNIEFHRKYSLQYNPIIIPEDMIREYTLDNIKKFFIPTYNEKLKFKFKELIE